MYITKNDKQTRKTDIAPNSHHHLPSSNGVSCGLQGTERKSEILFNRGK